MRKRRCIHSIIYCILQQIECEMKSITYIASQCRTNYRTVETIVKMLEEKGYVKIIHVNGRQFIALEDRGRKLLATLREVEDILTYCTKIS